MSVIEIHNLTVPVPGKKHSERVLLRDLNFSVASGEVLGIIGPNGAGKSSLLKTIDGALPYQGEVAFKQIKTQYRARAKQFAMLPQHSSLSFPFSVREVVALGRTPHATGKVRDDQIIQQVLTLLDIDYIAERSYTLLSGGEKQRTQLARVMCQIWPEEDDEKPRLLLLDEPSAALDLGHQHLLMRAIRQLADQGVAVIMVMHDINLAARYADKLLALLCSEQIAYGAPKVVVTKPIMQRLFGLEVEVLTSPENGQPVLIGA